MQNISSAVEAMLVAGQRARAEVPIDQQKPIAANPRSGHPVEVTAQEEVAAHGGNALDDAHAAHAGAAGDLRAPHGNGDLESLLARMLGWKNRRAIEHALSLIDLAAEGRVALVLRGAEDLVAIAWSLHRRAFGDDRPFVVCDPRRGNLAACVRSPANRKHLDKAIAAAAGGGLCVSTRRLPSDFAATVARLRDARDVMLILCCNDGHDNSPLLVRPAPVVIPPLTERADDLPRIVDEYARDAITRLGASPSAFTADDANWVRHHAASSLPEIEKGTLRLVALRASRSSTEAAARLGMELVSLHRWLQRREPISAWP